MNHIKIKEILIDGFTASSAEAGEKIKVTIAGSAISTEPIFYVYVLQILSIISRKVKEETGKTLIIDNIQRILLLIHADNAATLYINDFEETARIKAARTIEVGEATFSSDISDISAIMFPGIDIKPSDKVVHITRSGFIFGFYFDFSQNLPLETMSMNLALLKKRLLFEDHLQKSKSAAHGFDALVFTEGKTDVIHLKKAIEKLGLKSEFSLKFDETEKDFGDENLLTACEMYSRKPNDQPIICIFDRDNDKIIKKLEDKTITGNTFQEWGNNVFSFILPIPDHRKNYKNICIEMFYADEDIRRKDGLGKRLYFDNEIQKVILPGNRITYQRISPVASNEFTKRVFDLDVDKIVNEKSSPCAISKTCFATYIAMEQDGFKDLNFSSFAMIFETIKNILENVSMRSDSDRSNRDADSSSV